jgi:hypothetical protein
MVPPKGVGGGLLLLSLVESLFPSVSGGGRAKFCLAGGSDRRHLTG